MSRGKVVGKVVVRVGWVGKGGWLVDRSVGWLIGWLRRWLGWGGVGDEYLSVLCDIVY